MYCLLAHAHMRLMWCLSRRTAETDPEVLRIDNCLLTFSLFVLSLSLSCSHSLCRFFTPTNPPPHSRTHTLSLSISHPLLFPLSLFPSLSSSFPLSIPPSLSPSCVARSLLLPLPLSLYLPLYLLRSLPSSLPLPVSLPFAGNEERDLDLSFFGKHTPLPLSSLPPTSRQRPLFNNSDATFPCCNYHCNLNCNCDRNTAPHPRRRRGGTACRYCN